MKSFASGAAFRSWLTRHHRTAAELTVRCAKAHAGARGVTYLEALDEALLEAKRAETRERRFEILRRTP